MITDSKGVEIKVGQKVRVYQEEGPDYKATVVELFPDRPTVTDVGFWLDIDRFDGTGREGMMSHNMEVING